MEKATNEIERLGMLLIQALLRLPVASLRGLPPQRKSLGPPTDHYWLVGDRIIRSMLLFALCLGLACDSQGRKFALPGIDVVYSDRGRCFYAMELDEMRLESSAKGQIIHGLRYGEWAFFHENGRLARRGTYDAGKKTGVWYNWNDCGSLVEIESFRDDKRDGAYELRSELGKPLLIGRYRAGFRTGKWTIFPPNDTGLPAFYEVEFDDRGHRIR